MMVLVVVSLCNGRTVSAFRIAIAMEKKKSKSFPDALDKSDRKN
jgi:hypothetical protein